MLVEQLPIINLQLVNLNSASLIAIADASSYVTIPTSSQVALRVTAPGYPTINVPFNPGTVNIYKCVDLGITCTDSDCTSLPDGIWEVNYSVTIPGSANTVKGSPNVYTNVLKFIKIDQIKCKFQTIFLKMDTLCNCHNEEQKRLKEKLRHIKLLIDGSVAACNDSEYVLSYDLYTKADYALDHLGCGFKGNKSNWGCGC